jgi:hypothetical protein
MTMVVVIKLVHSTSIMCIQYGSSTDLGDAYIHVHAHTAISHSFEYNLRSTIYTFMSQTFSPVPEVHSVACPIVRAKSANHFLHVTPSVNTPSGNFH